MITSARSAAPSLSLICIHYALIDNIYRAASKPGTVFKRYTKTILTTTSTVDDIFEKSEYLSRQCVNRIPLIIVYRA